MKRAIAAGLVVLAACSSGGSGSDAGTTPGDEPTSTTTSTTAVPALTRAEIEARIAEIGPITTFDQTERVIEAVALGEDPDLLPYAYDAGRLGGRDLIVRAMEVIARISGETAPEGDLGAEWAFYGNWLVNNSLDPGADYIPWKAALFANIDPAFEPLLASVTDPVTATRLQWGGVTRGGIPELNDARTISVAEADYMVGDEIVFGAVINGQARAYPVRILGHHELANDTIGGEKVALAYCTLCRTPVLYSREVDGTVLDFQTSGLLNNSNKVMVDTQTDSLWNQLTGEAFAGPLTGERLTILPMTVTTWSEWIAEHPATDVQTVPQLLNEPDPGRPFLVGGYTYEPGDAYADYYASGDLWFPALEVPGAFELKTEVVTLDLNGEQLAVDLDRLLDSGGLVTEVGGVDVVFVAAGNGARVYESIDGVEVVAGTVQFAGQPVEVTEDAIVLPDGTALGRLISGQSFWFAWAGNYPDTAWWPDT